MKLLQFYENGTSQIKLGLAFDEYVVDLSSISEFANMKDLIAGFDEMRNQFLQYAANPPKSMVKTYDNISFLPPITNANKVICVGLNYLNHVSETKYQKPEYPVFFARYNSSFVGHKQNIMKPIVSNKCDYEGELVVIIGREGKNISKEQADEIIFGYSIFNDITLRDYQSKSSQWLMGKNFDQAGAFGPWIVTKDELPYCGEGLRLQTYINDQLVQDDLTSNMIFPIAELISILSEVFTLSPGDMIVTGTPAGVGFAQDPKLYLQDGDKCEIVIEKIGRLVNIVAQEK